MDNIFGINLAIFFELIKKLINFAMQTKNKRITIRILSVVKTFREGESSLFPLYWNVVYVLLLLMIIIIIGSGRRYKLVACSSRG